MMMVSSKLRTAAEEESRMGNAIVIDSEQEQGQAGEDKGCPAKSIPPQGWTPLQATGGLPWPDSAQPSDLAVATLLWGLWKSEVAVQFLRTSASWGQPASSWSCQEGLRWPEHCAESSCRPFSAGHGGSFESIPLHKVMEAVHRCGLCTNRTLFSQTRAGLGLGAKSSKFLLTILNHYYYLVLFVGS